MTEEQIKVLAKYLGSRCEKEINGVMLHNYVFDFHDLMDTFQGNHGKVKLILNPLFSLTQEDFERLGKYLSWQKEGIDRKRWLRAIDINDLAWRIADWLRNNGYYLGEENIKQFVKMK